LPRAELFTDSSDNLYGTTDFGGGTGKFGTVVKLTQGAGGAWTNSVLYAFTNGADGGQPVSSLVFDAAGNLYGTTTAGGDPTCFSFHGFCGVVFELSPTSGGTWRETVLRDFTGTDGLVPTAGLVFDSSGKLYGTTSEGGSFGKGAVFELFLGGGGAWTEIVLHSFNQSSDGGGPNSLLVFDGAGDIFGTTEAGGDTGCSSFGCGQFSNFCPSWGEPG
jgi:uncharacterized repeat protein (TIGR03803 family)